MHKPRVFLDSSVIIAALLSSRGASYYLLSQQSDIFDFQINEYVFEEVRRSLEAKFSNQPTLVSNLFLLIGAASIRMISNPATREVSAAEDIISKKDASILASALTHSDYLLTLDNEFFKPVITLTAKEKNLVIIKPGHLLNMLI